MKISFKCGVVNLLINCHAITATRKGNICFLSRIHTKFNPYFYVCYNTKDGTLIQEKYNFINPWNLYNNVMLFDQNRSKFWKKYKYTAFNKWTESYFGI